MFFLSFRILFLVFNKFLFQFFIFSTYREFSIFVLATNSILPEGYDPMDPTQWAQEEVIIESTETFVKQEIPEIEEQTHIYECYKCAKRFNFKDKLFR